MVKPLLLCVYAIYTQPCLLIINGENPKVIATLEALRCECNNDLYSHVTSDLQDGVAQRFEDMFFKDSVENALAD